MNLIKIVLVGGGLALFFYFMAAARGRPIQKIAMSAVFLAIVCFALFPDLSNRVARWAGVGRGVDLALYLSTITLLSICFSLYLGQKRLEARLLVVVRELGLMTARSAQEAAKQSDPGAEREPEAVSS